VFFAPTVDFDTAKASQEAVEVLLHGLTPVK